MGASFAGFTKSGLDFFRQLEKNNDRDWFDAHKQVFLDHVKAPMEALVASVGAEMLRFAPEYVVEPKRAIFRIYRDTRFSKNKAPYKTSTGALLFRAELGKNEAAAFYFEVSHRYLGVAGGVYMPDAEKLRLIRAHIAETHSEFNRLLRV